MDMSKVEFQAARGVLRWASVGVMPGERAVRCALDGIESLGAAAQTQGIREVLSGLGRGILPQQRVCQDATLALEAIYDHQDADGDRYEAPHG